MSSVIEPEVLPPTELALHVPKDIETLLAEPTRFELEANEFEVNSEAAYQVADQIKESLKSDAKLIDNVRLDEFIRPLQGIEKKWNRFFSPHITGRTNAVATYEMKMIAFRLERQKKTQEAQQEAERQLQKQKQEQLARAQKLEERAAVVKTDSAKQRLFEEAERIKEAAVLMPETVAISATEPQGTASDTRDNWKSLPKEGRMRDALLWLADHPEWWKVVGWTPIEMKKMAKQFHNCPERAEPFRIWNDMGFATKRK